MLSDSSRQVSFFEAVGLNLPYIHMKLTYDEEMPETKKYNAFGEGVCWIRYMASGLSSLRNASGDPVWYNYGFLAHSKDLEKGSLSVVGYPCQLSCSREPLLKLEPLYLFETVFATTYLRHNIAQCALLTKRLFSVFARQKMRKITSRRRSC